MTKTIIENGIRVYLNHFCHCPCGERIPWNKYHKNNDIPNFILNHNKRSNEIWLEPTIIKNGIKYYKNHFCKCKCGRRIPFPTTNAGLNNHKYLGIPKYIQRHHPTSSHFKKGHKLQSGKKNSMYGKNLTKEHKDKLSKSAKKHPENQKKATEAARKYFQTHPKEKIASIEKAHKAQRTKGGSKPQLTVYKYAKKLFSNNTVSKEVPIYVGNKLYYLDIVIPHIQTVIEVDGCYHHKCLECYPLQENMDKALNKRNYDRLRKANLEKLKIKVIRIWTHDVDSGKYKEILKKLL